jgi:hypothetical protein
MKNCKKCGKPIGYWKVIDGKAKKIGDRKLCLECSPYKEKGNNKQSEAVQRCQRRKKQKAVDYLGGKCSICGYDKCLGSLHFHHIDPEIKEHYISYVVARREWDFAKKELDKCILVCSNCHGEIHWGQFEVEEIKNKVVRLNTVKCPICERNFFTKDKDQVFCNQECYQYSLRKVEWPTKEQLTEDIKQNSWVALGRKYNVSDNAVRKWARSYGLL